MKRQKTVVLHLRDHQVILSSGQFRADLEDLNSWTELRMAIGRNAALAIIVDDAATYEVELPSLPKSRRKLKEMLAVCSPVLLKSIAWSSPATALEGRKVTAAVVQADWLDPRVEQIECQLMPASITVRNESGRTFDYTSVPERRRRRASFAFVGFATCLTLMAILFALWSSVRSSSGRETTHADIFARPGVVETISTLSRASSSEIQFRTVAMDSRGQLAVTIDTDQPAGMLRVVSKELPQAVALTSTERGGASVLAFSHPPLRTGGGPVRSAPALAATDKAKATRLMLSSIVDMAHQAGVTTRIAPIEQSHDYYLAWSLTAIGSSGNVLAFVQNLESSEPVARLESWRLVEDSAGMTLTAKLITPWSKSR